MAVKIGYQHAQIARKLLNKQIGAVSKHNKQIYIN